MREDLLGYLLSALEPHEMRRIEEALRDDPLLEFELEQLRKSLTPLDQAIAELPVIQTPPDLVARTLAMLPPMPEASGANQSPSLAMAPALEGRGSRRFVWLDLLVAGLASAAVLALLIPSIARGRYEARKSACQDHLRQLGTAITMFVMLDGRQSLPRIEENGPFAFSGMYAPLLRENELLDDNELILCPEVELPTSTMAGSTYASNGKTEATSPVLIDSVVRVDDVREAHQRSEVDKLKWMQQTAGGNYAYTLGVIDGDHYESPRYEGRASFAVLGDAPISGIESTEGVDVERLRWGHGDSGANVLFEDGSVRFLDMSHGSQFSDHPFLNHRGSLEAGVNIDDASLAPSSRPPFVSSLQR